MVVPWLSIVFPWFSQVFQWFSKVVPWFSIAHGPLEPLGRQTSGSFRALAPLTDVLTEVARTDFVSGSLGD